MFAFNQGREGRDLLCCTKCLRVQISVSEVLRALRQKTLFIAICPILIVFCAISSFTSKLLLETSKYQYGRCFAMSCDEFGSHITYAYMS